MKILLTLNVFSSTGMVPFAIGSETAGSITYPAARCGVTALRPTFGTVGRSGVMSISESLVTSYCPPGLFLCDVNNDDNLIHGRISSVHSVGVLRTALLFLMLLEEGIQMIPRPETFPLIVHSQ